MIAAQQPVRFFIVTATVFGMLFLLITPPFQGADEVVHFLRAYQVSGGNLVIDNTPKGPGGEMPTALSKIITATSQPPVQFHWEYKYNWHETVSALQVRDVRGQHMFYDLSPTAPYPPVPYVPAVIGIDISRLLHLPPMVSLYAGRLGNLLAWVALIALAIKLLPSRKWAMVAIGLLPMGLFQASMLNGDVVTTGTLALFLALILYYKEQKTRLGKKELAYLLLTASAMVLSKQVMVVFLPLLLLLGKQNFASIKARRITCAGLMVVPLLVFAVWFMIAQGINIKASYANGQDPAAQVSFVLHNPLRYAIANTNTFFFNWGDSITRSFVGTFGWADTPLSENIVTIGYIGLFLLLVGTYENNIKSQLTRREKQLVLLTAALCWLAIGAALYLYYSPVGFRILYGLQGRYYIPVAVALVPIIWTRRIKLDRSLYQALAVVLPLFLLSSSVVTVFVRYFIRNV